MRQMKGDSSIAKSKLYDFGGLHSTLIQRAWVQIALMLLVTVTILVQLESDNGYSALNAVGSSYATYSSSFTNEPLVEESARNTTAQGKADRSMPLFGIIPIYVAVMSLVILFVVSGGFIILYLYGTGQLR